MWARLFLCGCPGEGVVDRVIRASGQYETMITYRIRQRRTLPYVAGVIDADHLGLERPQ